MYQKRYLTPFIEKDLQRKMVFLGGARQTGKTTLAKVLLGPDHEISHYFNWDADEDRERILKKEFPLKTGVIVLDEVHKYVRWRQLLKGLFDKKTEGRNFLVTGSARLDYYRRGGDSLQGRYHYYRLHPFTMGELKLSTQENLEALLRFGGHPEPFILANETETKRWSREYRSRLIREDLRDLEKINEISLIERLAIRLPDLVGSPLSINALREDLQVAHQTVARWLEILERMYFIFRLLPFGSPKIRAVKKELKHYHCNWTEIDNEGLRFENLVASHLLKWCHFLEDTEGEDMELRYFRDIDKREVDFVVLQKRKPILFLETKVSETSISSHLRYLKLRHPEVETIQITLKGDREFVNADGIKLMPARLFLSNLPC